MSNKKQIHESSPHKFYLPKDLSVSRVVGRKRTMISKVLPETVQFKTARDEEGEYIEFSLDDDKLLGEVKQKWYHLIASVRALGQIQAVVPNIPEKEEEVFVRFCEEPNVIPTYNDPEHRYVVRCANKDNDHYDSMGDQNSFDYDGIAAQVVDQLLRGLKEIGDKIKKNQTLRGKLEVRFGKKLWFAVPKEVIGDNMTVKELKQLMEYHKSNRLDYSVDATQVNDLSKELEDHCPPSRTVKIYNFNITVSDGSDRRQCIYLRTIVMDDNEISIDTIRRNDVRQVSVDVLCLNRKHDFRLQLECYEPVCEGDPEYRYVEKFVKSIKILEPGYLSFQPCTAEWTTDCVYYTKETVYVLEKQFVVTVSESKGYNVDKKGMWRNKLDTKLKDNWQGPWRELEISNNPWEWLFLRDVGPACEKADSGSLAKKVSHPWNSESLISIEDLQEFLKRVNWLSEQLK